MNQRSDPLRMFGVREAFEEAVHGAEYGKSHFRPVDERREAFVMAFARLAEEHGLNAAPGAQRFFDEPDALDAHEAILRGQSAAQSHTEFLEPAIVATGEERRVIGAASVAGELSWRSHHPGG